MRAETIDATISYIDSLEKQNRTLREFLNLYIKTYMRTQSHPSVIEEAAVMAQAQAIANETA